MIYKLTTVLDPELAAVAQITRLELRSAGAVFELVQGPFAIAGAVAEGRVAALELRVPDDPTAAPIADRVAIVRALLALAFGFSVTLADASIDLYDELALHGWFGLPPPPTPAEAHDAVVAQLAAGRDPDRELVGRALADPRADELIAQLGAGAPPVEPFPTGTRDLALLARISRTFNGYALVGPIGGYANRVRRAFLERGDVPRTAAAARLCLFFEQRRRVHQARDPSEADWRYFDALFDVIRR